jgi:hypothetical protein
MTAPLATSPRPLLVEVWKRSFDGIDRLVARHFLQNEGEIDRLRIEPPRYTVVKDAGAWMSQSLPSGPG